MKLLESEKAITTIHVDASDYVDKKNKKSFFSVFVTIDWDMPSERTINLVFQMGGNDTDYYVRKVFSTLIDKGLINDYERLWDDYWQINKCESFYRYCNRKGIKLRIGRYSNCN